MLAPSRGRAALFLGNRCSLFAESGSCRFWQMGDRPFFLGSSRRFRDIPPRCIDLAKALSSLDVLSDGRPAGWSLAWAPAQVSPV
jgi:hypothetical protein